jgi:hypothetical protein
MEQESIVFRPVREDFPSEYAFRARFSHFSVSLTSPSGRKYITHVVKQGDSSVGAGIRPAAEKANSYPFRTALSIIKTMCLLNPIMAKSGLCPLTINKQLISP